MPYKSSVQKALFALSDPNYKTFHAKLIPNIPADRIIGIRMPVLRKFAASFAKTSEAALFLEELPHRYYEENTLHALLIMKIKEEAPFLHALNRFLPYVDNWATCDSMSPAIFKNHPEKLWKLVPGWISSKHPYTVRFGIEMLMKYCLETPEDAARALLICSMVRSNEYYVNMMIAWFFATALAKSFSLTLPYLEKPVLDVWTHNKALQKARESFRITEEQKNYLKTLKRTV